MCFSIASSFSWSYSNEYKLALAKNNSVFFWLKPLKHSNLIPQLKLEAIDTLKINKLNNYSDLNTMMKRKIKFLKPTRLSVEPNKFCIYKMIMTENWSQKPMMICELHMTSKKQ